MIIWFVILLDIGNAPSSIIPKLESILIDLIKNKMLIILL